EEADELVLRRRPEDEDPVEGVDEVARQIDPDRGPPEADPVARDPDFRTEDVLLRPGLVEIGAGEDLDPLVRRHLRTRIEKEAIAVEVEGAAVRPGEKIVVLLPVQADEAEVRLLPADHVLAQGEADRLL